jgi:tRNA A37 threonylcarbamoyladenosine modification protein TsaB
LNSIIIDLTSDKHFVALNYAQKKYFFDFKEESLKKRNDWQHKISTIIKNIPDFEFKKIEKMAYAAGPGSYTGARLAYTFLDTMSLILNKEFYAFSNLTALQHNFSDRIAIIKGGKKDFFYRYNERDHYCESFEQIPKDRAYVVLEKDQLQLENTVELKSEDISKNILDLILDSDEKALSSNYPNYIKELNYVKNR